MSPIASFSPKPVSSSAVQPEMPITVINRRFLYLNRFRAVTLWVNFIRRHIKPTRSSSILLPLLGALGSISAAGFSRKAAITAHKVAARMQITAAVSAPNDIGALKLK